jgi:hypothetical protein
MHTIDGSPATFDGYQICYAAFYGKPNKLADSLKQIRQEQRLTVKNRRADGLAPFNVKYGYLRYE